jgi:hypothetical protein
VFLKRNTGFQGKVATDLSNLDVENEQIKFRKDFLGKYLKKLVTAKYDEGFIKYLDYVGKIHINFDGRKEKPHIDYVHCSALFTYVSSFIIEALMSAGLPKDVEKKTVLAFNKLLWIQNDYFAKWYVRDGEEWTGLSKPKTSVEKYAIPASLVAGGLALGVLVATRLFR